MTVTSRGGLFASYWAGTTECLCVVFTPLPSQWHYVRLNCVFAIAMRVKGIWGEGEGEEGEDGDGNDFDEQQAREVQNHKDHGRNNTKSPKEGTARIDASFEDICWLSWQKIAWETRQTSRLLPRR